jgi:hypothetical protein
MKTSPYPHACEIGASKSIFKLDVAQLLESLLAAPPRSVRGGSFDHLVGAGDGRRWHFEAECLGAL